MLPICLVLLVASSALAAPSVLVNVAGINEVAPPHNNGKLVSSYKTERAFEIVDGGDTNVYILTVQQILNDLANLPDSNSQALAIGQTLAVLSQLATGTPGDACVAANLIDAYESSIRSGNTSGAYQALVNFVDSIAANIDLIVQLANNPNSGRYSVGPRSNCAGGGRTYAFEAAWTSVLANANPAQAGLINEQYCAAKRLYSAFNTRSNNVGAYLTAASLPPFVQAVEIALEPVARFLGAIATGNPHTHAGAAKQALVNSLRVAA